MVGEVLRAVVGDVGWGGGWCLGECVGVWWAGEVWRREVENGLGVGVVVVVVGRGEGGVGGPGRCCCVAAQRVL